MTPDEFRAEMEAYRSSVHDEARSLKSPEFALRRLFDLYLKFDQDERLMADAMLGEWLTSQEECVRFDALALIHQFKILSALPALDVLAIQLEASRLPSAPYEQKKLERIRVLLVREEARDEFDRETLDRWNEYVTTGKSVSAEAADAWLARLEAGEDVPPPEAE